jgi:hypothetical protein
MSRIITGVADAQQRGNATLENGNFTLLREFAASGISVGCANTFLNPIGKQVVPCLLLPRTRLPKVACLTVQEFHASVLCCAYDSNPAVAPCALQDRNPTHHYTALEFVCHDAPSCKQHVCIQPQ